MAADIDATAFMPSSQRPAGPSQPVIRAWIHLMRSQRILLAAIERDLKAAGLPPLGWYDVLLELTRAAEGRLRPFEIEERILLAQYNLSRLLDRLEAGGLVRREAFGIDRRGQWVVLTEAGRAMQERIWIVYAASLQKHIGSKMDAADADALAELLARLTR